MDKNKPRYSTAKPFTCWLFCTVIDNFGDIGVSWRLAQELRQRLGWQVHLWLDNLAALQAIAPMRPPPCPAPIKASSYTHGKRRNMPIWITPPRPIW